MINTNVQKWGGVVASLVSILALSSAAEAITFTSPTGSYNIPDDNLTGVTASINISGQPNISSFNSVTISGLTHIAYADLRAFLSNGTTTVQLFRSNLVDSQEFTNWSFDLNGNYTFANTGANWYTETSETLPSATYASFQPLSAFNGSPLNGTWTLNVQDDQSGDLGAFSSFSIDATPTPVPFESNAAPAGMAIVFGAFMLRRRLQQRSAQKMLAESVDS
ncbi:MAG: proprotein convertase P-domain-containing protein [Dolichospermum sp.]